MVRTAISSDGVGSTATSSTSIRRTQRAKSGTGSRVYLKYTSKNKLLLPVSPESITMESPFGVNKIDVAHRGQFTTAGFRGVRTIEFSSFLPARYNASYCTYKFTKSAEWQRRRIENYRTKRKPLYLVITDLRMSMKVLIEDFSVEYKGGEKGDIYYTLKLVEYKAPPSTLIKKKKKKKSTKKKSSKSASKKTRAKNEKYAVKKGQTYTVVKGDTLQKIAKKFYGATNRWRDVYALNRAKIGANPNRIYPGQKLVIRKK